MTAIADPLLQDLETFIQTYETRETSNQVDRYRRYEAAKDWLLRRALSDGDYERAARFVADYLEL